MFRLSKPTPDAIAGQVVAASRLTRNSPKLLDLSSGLQTRALPFAFSHDQTISCLGKGMKVFDAARSAFESWTIFDLGWVRVANPTAKIAVGQIVAVEAQALGLWSSNLSRIEETICTTTRFGFLYATTIEHIEQGEERFLLEFDPDTGNVWYELEAVSRPWNALARLGFPVTRAYQRRFARDSHRRMREVIQGSCL